MKRSPPSARQHVSARLRRATAATAPGSLMVRCNRTHAGARQGESVVLEQPLDIVELELRAGDLAEAPAQFLQNAPCPLHVDLARNLDGRVVAVVAAPQRPTERI